MSDEWDMRDDRREWERAQQDLDRRRREDEVKAAFLELYEVAPGWPYKHESWDDHRAAWSLLARELGIEKWFNEEIK